MLVVRGRLENRQAIIRIGLQPFIPEAVLVEPEQHHVEVPIAAYSALIDTGAQRTCLAQRVIVQEKLVRVGKKFIQNVHSAAMHYTYWTNIGFWTNGADGDRSERHGYYALPFPTEIINIADNENFDAIIGMDVLQKFDLMFDRTGDFEIRLA